MKRNATISRYVYRLLHTLLLFCVIVLAFSGISTWEMLKASQNLFSSNNALTEFYRVVDRLDFSAKDCLIPHDAQEETVYDAQLEEARGYLQQIYDIGDENLVWRFGRLENMLDSYDQVLVAFQQGKTDIFDTYARLTYGNTLIKNTATSYYGYLSDYLHTHAHNIQQRWQIKFVLQVAAFVLLVMMGVLINRRTERLILQPVQIMTENARRIREGEFTLEPVGRAPEELTIMSEAFSDMAEQVKKNIEVLKENARLEQALLQQESEQLIMQNLVTQAQLHSLQAQINPHFLFNTLSMISKSAYLSQDISTSELIERLADFLRYALDKSSTTTTLQEEIRSIEDYFFIQKRRFGDLVQFEVDVARDIPKLDMPAIVLQPLVENSIKHGFGAVPEPLVISLKVRYSEGRVRIILEDDGAGMQPQQLENLQSCLRRGLESSSGVPGTSIGLTNVYQRLKIYFGSGMQFSIESEVNCGTVISISLPGGEKYDKNISASDCGG